MDNALSVGDIALTQSRFLCLHVTEFTSSDTPFGVVTGPNWIQIETLRQQLVSRCESERLQCVVAEHATTDSMRRTFFKQPTAIDWLTQNSGLTNSEAATIIHDFPVSVAPQMCQNARNPTQFLGLAAAIARQPDVIIYSTSGMDPRGVSLLHSYATDRYTDGCLIHVSTCELAGVECGHSGECLVVNVNSPKDDA